MVGGGGRGAGWGGCCSANFPVKGKIGTILVFFCQIDKIKDIMLILTSSFKIQTRKKLKPFLAEGKCNTEDGADLALEL